MKKNLTILSILCALALGLTIAGCGAKRDEALVAEFAAKQTEANKVITDAQNQAKMMGDDHKVWSAKLDSVAKTPKADTTKINMFKAEIKKMDDMTPAMMAMVDSLKAYTNAKTSTNDELKAAIAGINAQLSAFTTHCNSMMDTHKKLGADIMAMLGVAAPVAEMKPDATKKAPAAKPAPGANEIPKTMDNTVHKAPTTPVIKKSAGNGGTIKQ